MFVILRVAIGLVLLISGIEKTLSPYQNFLYVIQAYQMLPTQIETYVAVALPWIELFIGLFMVLGLWVPVTLKATAVMFAAFIVVVGQALLRCLPIDQCGCFGQDIHIPPSVIIVFDSAVLLLTYLLTRNVLKTSNWSLDNYFRK